MNYILTLGFVALEMGKQKKKTKCKLRQNNMLTTSIFTNSNARKTKAAPQLSFIASNFYSLFFYLVSQQPKGA